jgi:hypothetical protein
MPFNFNLKKSSFDFPSHDKSHSIHQARCRKNTQSTGAISNIAIKPPESIDHVRCIQDDVFLCFIHKVLFGSIDDAIMMNLSVLLDGSLEGGRVGTDVGMARMECSWAASGTSSTSTLKKRALV